MQQGTLAALWLLRREPNYAGTKSARAHANLLATDRLDTGGSVRIMDIRRFHNEGFKMIGKVKLLDTPPTHPTITPSSQL